MSLIIKNELNKRTLYQQKTICNPIWIYEVYRCPLSFHYWQRGGSRVNVEKWARKWVSTCLLTHDILSHQDISSTFHSYTGLRLLFHVDEGRRRRCSFRTILPIISSFISLSFFLQVTNLRESILFCRCTEEWKREIALAPLNIQRERWASMIQTSIIL
jgi:hypothetical protein